MGKGCRRGRRRIGRTRRSGGRRWPWSSGPNQHFSTFVNRALFGVDEFILKVFKIGVIEIKAPLDGAIRHPAFAL
jgi:hypothetical protein